MTVETDPEIVKTERVLSNGKWKWLFFGTAAVCLLTITAFVTTTFLLNKSQQEIIKDMIHYQDRDGNDVSETIKEDLTGHTATYTVTTKGKDITIFTDYNKKLVVTSEPHADDPHCTVHFLNATTAEKRSENKVDPSAPRQPMWLERDVEAIKDTSFLPYDAQELCDGMPVYWATQKYNQEDSTEMEVSEPGARDKRAVYVYCYAYTYCSWYYGCWDVYYLCGVYY